jgi:hypothetical protein
MRVRALFCAMAIVAACGRAAWGQSADKVVRVGAGSYLTALPAGAREPPPALGGGHRGSRSGRRRRA